MLRILFNTYPVAFDCLGGGEIQILRTREALERSGHQVLLFDQWKPQFDRVDIVQYFSVQGGSMNFCAYVKQRGLALVVAPIIWLVKEKLGDYPLDEISDILHIADIIVPNSAAEKEQLADYFEIARDRFALTTNGVDPSFASDVSPNLFRTRFGIRSPFLLNVANVEPRKNQHRLIQAVRGLDVQLILMGRIRDQSYMDYCIGQGAGNVRHVGYLEHGTDLMKSAYRACSAFVLPSLLETPGLSALEAAVAGARVVVTSEGSAREYFKDMVTYVNPLDVNDIRRGIESAIHGESHTRLQDHVLSNFTWNRTAEQLGEAYRRALGQHL